METGTEVLERIQGLRDASKPATQQDLTNLEILNVDGLPTNALQLTVMGNTHTVPTYVIQAGRMDWYMDEGTYSVAITYDIGSGVWGIGVSATGDLIYVASIVSDALLPWEATGIWDIFTGSGQPVFAVPPSMTSRRHVYDVSAKALYHYVGIYKQVLTADDLDDFIFDANAAENLRTQIAGAAGKAVMEAADTTELLAATADALDENLWLPRGHNGMRHYFINPHGYTTTATGSATASNVGDHYEITSGGTAASTMRATRSSIAGLVPYGVIQSGRKTMGFGAYPTKFAFETHCEVTTGLLGSVFRSGINANGFIGNVAPHRGFAVVLHGVSATNVDVHITGIPTVFGAGSTPNITAATNASPIVITTASAHNLTSGNIVDIDGVVGNTAANDIYTVTVLSATTFSLNTSTGNGTYTSGGNFALCSPALANINADRRTHQITCYTVPQGSNTFNVQAYVNGTMVGTSPTFGGSSGNCDHTLFQRNGTGDLRYQYGQMELAVKL